MSSLFQGTITQIILDGNLDNSLVIRRHEDVHELTVPSAIYSLKTVGKHTGSPRVNVTVQLLPATTNLFATQEEVSAYQDRLPLP